MRWSLQNWVEEIKAKPEPIRKRYVIGCVFVSMFFILIIWSLNVSESLKKSTTDPAVAAPNIHLPKPSDFSLDDVLSGQSAAESTTPKSSDQFLREQVESRERINPSEQGVVPKDDRTSATDETTSPY